MRLTALIILACVWTALVVLGVRKRLQNAGDDGSNLDQVSHYGAASKQSGERNHG